MKNYHWIQKKNMSNMDKLQGFSIVACYPNCLSLPQLHIKLEIPHPELWLERKENERSGHYEHLISTSPEDPLPPKSKKMLCGILFFYSHPFSTQNKHIKGGEIRLDFTKMDNNLFLLLFSYHFIRKCSWGWPFQMNLLHTVHSDLM